MGFEAALFSGTVLFVERDVKNTEFVVVFCP